MVHKILLPSSDEKPLHGNKGAARLEAAPRPHKDTLPQDAPMGNTTPSAPQQPTRLCWRSDNLVSEA